MTLVPASVDLAPRVWEAVERSLVELTPWMAWAADASLASTEAWAAGVADRAERGEERVFVMLTGDEVVGVVGLNHIDALLRSAQVGYWVRSDRADRGLATEAVAAVLEHAFGPLGLHRLELHAGVENHASKRVAERLGFRHEGLARHGSRGAYGFYDCDVYGLLETDPRPPIRAREDRDRQVVVVP